MLAPFSPRTVVIVGAGFSGAVTAVHLLRSSRGMPLRVVLVNRSGRMARGTAYGTASAEHVLNVPAGNMSALADEPDDFLRYCRWANPEITPASFVSRRLYGSYLEALLDAAEHGAHEAASLERVVGEVRAVEVHGERATVRLEGGRSMEADRVVLAFGHFEPRDPPVPDGSFYESPRYVRDPWAPGVLADVRPDEPVLLLGSGLTAVDVALALGRQGRSAPMWCVSRRGLLPQPHRAHAGAMPPEALERLLATMGCGVRQHTRALREAVQAHCSAGGDWRDVIGALRARTPALWHALSQAERRRFVRRLQPHWDTLRHRCAPQAFERFEGLRGAGLVRHVAGRVRSYEAHGPQVDVAIAPRSGGDTLRLQVSRVVNCTGPNTDLRQVRDPLVRQLVDAGMLCPDPLGLGLEVDSRFAIVGAGGRACPVLRYIGPLLRARDWEATAVPELRVHALALAQELLGAAVTSAR